ncbi:hypothetical protein ES705_33558 [subsurface metagenome]
MANFPVEFFFCFPIRNCCDYFLRFEQITQSFVAHFRRVAQRCTLYEQFASFQWRGVFQAFREFGEPAVEPEVGANTGCIRRKQHFVDADKRPEQTSPFHGAHGRDAVVIK